MKPKKNSKFKPLVKTPKKIIKLDTPEEEKKNPSLVPTSPPKRPQKKKVTIEDHYTPPSKEDRLKKLRKSIDKAKRQAEKESKVTNDVPYISIVDFMLEKLDELDRHFQTSKAPEASNVLTLITNVRNRIHTENAEDPNFERAMESNSEEIVSLFTQMTAHYYAEEAMLAFQRIYEIITRRTISLDDAIAFTEAQDMINSDPEYDIENPFL